MNGPIYKELNAMRTVTEESDCILFGDLDAVTTVAASQHLCPCIKSLFTAEYTFVIYCKCMVLKRILYQLFVIDYGNNQERAFFYTLIVW
jgi:hypothetical protein